MRSGHSTVSVPNQAELKSEKALNRFVRHSTIGIVVAFLLLILTYWILYLLELRLTLPFLLFLMILASSISYYFIIRPAYHQFSDIYLALVDSEGAAKKMTQEVNKLYTELGKSYQDLEAVNFVQDDPAALLKLSKNGDIETIYDRFLQIIGLQDEDFHHNIFDWFESENQSVDFIKNLQELMSNAHAWNGELNLTDAEGDLIWLEVAIQPIQEIHSDGIKFLVLGTDVTDIKEAKQRSREINREAISQRVKEQQYRSVLILEGQEEERKRISQEIHDGIGQMLTGLKLNLEGISATNSRKMEQRIEDTKDLMKRVIKEVRRVSFNLTPSSLVDFGIVPAMKKISQEVSALTSTEVVFENRTNFINRLDKNTETNLYRIVQEAVNNAIKYAQADKIVISFEHDPIHLKICVEDNGQGFEYDKLERSGHFGASGHGIFNMKERAAFINGSLDVRTGIGEGTKIIIKLPLS